MYSQLFDINLLVCFYTEELHGFCEVYLHAEVDFAVGQIALNGDSFVRGQFMSPIILTYQFLVCLRFMPLVLANGHLIAKC